MPPKFEVVEDDVQPEKMPSHVLDTLLEGVKALPKSTTRVLSNCFALITVATVFWLSMLIIPYNPNAFQLAGLAGYALFIIAVNIITRK